ncbi:MAG: hypothetical protein HLUCCX14_07650 [Marinobacter excellens HL-55]|uniref:Uncharacterized protein n=1 Tax=Marinobacter excellens HL-55 TaxID=1305731 RepID=A0A0P8B6D6_9GAMM|nr:MAG: hypothetical protein HLUCCX14_07650 [Marinobacter excellens HL-55]
MRQEYQKQYLAEVEALADSGFEMYLLGGQALREIDHNCKVSDQYVMPGELKLAVKKACQGFSLELSSLSAASINEHSNRQKSVVKAKGAMKQLTNHDD